MSYGLVDPYPPSPARVEACAGGAEAIAGAVSRARFVGTESAADEVVLFSIVALLSRLVLSPCGKLLGNAALCEILNSAFR